MDNVLDLIIIFPIAITLHNIEEALWLPRWSQDAGKYVKPVGRGEFHFALICVTVMAYLVSFGYMLFPELSLLKFMYFGFLGSMIINAVFPHFVATLVLRKYAPGLITGLFVNLPVFSMLVYRAIDEGVISLIAFGVSSVILGVSLLALLPLLFRIGRSLVKVN